MNAVDFEAHVGRLHTQVAEVKVELTGLRDELRTEIASRNTRWAIHDERHQNLAEMHLESRVQVLEDWRIEMVTLGRLVRLTLGASIVGAIAAILALYETVTHVIGGG